MWEKLGFAALLVLCFSLEKEAAAADFNLIRHCAALLTEDEAIDRLSKQVKTWIGKDFPQRYDSQGGSHPILAPSPHGRYQKNLILILVDDRKDIEPLRSALAQSLPNLPNVNLDAFAKSAKTGGEAGDYVEFLYKILNDQSRIWVVVSSPEAMALGEFRSLMDHYPMGHLACEPKRQMNHLKAMLRALITVSYGNDSALSPNMSELIDKLEKAYLPE